VLKTLVRHLSWLALKSPEPVGRAAACGIGFLAARLFVRDRDWLYETIDRVFTRMKREPPASVEKIVNRVFAHFALNIYEILRYPNLSVAYLDEIFSHVNIKYFDEAIKNGKGVILSVPHLGNWELMGAFLAYKGYPLHSFYLSQKEDDFTSILDYFRSFSKIVLHDRDRGGLSALKALKKGAVLGMIADQDGGNQAVYGNFLGHWVAIPAGPANWSLKTGAVVVPGYCLRKGISSHFQACFYPALPEEEGTYEQRVVKRTMRLAQIMERSILAHPEQYLWFYDRFKPRHEGHIAKLKKAGVKMCHDQPVYVTTG